MAATLGEHVTFVPESIFGYTITAHKNIHAESVCFLQLEEDVFSATVHIQKWQLSNFEVSNKNLKSGHFLTYSLKHNSEEFNLVQNRSVFFTNSPTLIKAGSALASGPIWHKSDHAWPYLEDQPLNFLCQFYYLNKVAYLFSMNYKGSVVYAIFDDELDRQDIEEHYANEKLT